MVDEVYCESFTEKYGYIWLNLRYSTDEVTGSCARIIQELRDSLDEFWPAQVYHSGARISLGKPPQYPEYLWLRFRSYLILR